MTDQETAAHIRAWCSAPQDTFSWATDGCGYEQHIRFVEHRNKHWPGGNEDAFRAFALAYANSLAPEAPKESSP